jgi:hypothetical protein
MYFEIIGEIESIEMIASGGRIWYSFVTSTEALWPSGEVHLQSRFLHSVRCAHCGRNDRRFFL